MLTKGDTCPKCNKPQMPPWDESGHETARCCQSCFNIEERSNAPSSNRADPRPPESKQKSV